MQKNLLRQQVYNLLRIQRITDRELIRNLRDNLHVLRLLAEAKKALAEDEIKGLLQFLDKSYASNGEVRI